MGACLFTLCPCLLLLLRIEGSWLVEKGMGKGKGLISFPCSQPPNPAQNFPLQAPTNLVLPFLFRNIEIVEHPLTIYTYHDNFLHFLPISHLTRFSCPQVFVHSKYLWIHFCILPFFFLLWSDATFSTLLWILPGGWSTYPQTLIFLFLFCFVILTCNLSTWIQDDSATSLKSMGFFFNGLIDIYTQGVPITFIILISIVILLSFHYMMDFFGEFEVNMSLDF